MFFCSKSVLFLWSILRTKEARSLAESLLVYFGSSAYYSGRVPLHLQSGFSRRKKALLYVFKVLVTLCCFFPLLHLTLEKGFHFIAGCMVLKLLVEGFSGFYFKGAEMILVGVVAIDFLLAECRVAVAFPASTEVHFVEDSPYAVASAYHEPQGIVFSVTGIGNLEGSKNGGVEGSGSTKTVDAKSVVATVFGSPLAVVDEPRGKRVQLEVAHSVGTDDHRSPLCIEGVHDVLKGGGGAVEVVAVQLYEEASHFRMVNGHVPTSSYAEVIPFGNEVDHTTVMIEFSDCFRRTVRTTIVHYHEVEGEIRILFQYAFYGELLQLQEDRGGNAVIRAHEQQLMLVEVGQQELTDCDTPQALQELKKSAGVR